MSQHNGSLDGDVLDAATDRLRDVATSQIPAGLIASTAKAIGNRPLPVTRHPRWKRTGLRLSSIAATALLVVAGVAALVMQGSANVVLAQVIDTVKNAESVQFVIASGGKTSKNERKCLFQGEKFRVEHPLGIVMIADRKEQEGIFVDSQSKTAGRFKLTEQVSREFATDPIAQLQQVRSDDAERLTTEVVNGKDAEVFQVRGIKLFGTESDNGEMRVWVDAKSKLPVRIELRLGMSPIVTFSEMKWNSAIDASLLSLKIPRGFSEQPEDSFRKRLRPDAASDKALTPTEAFRKFHQVK